MNKEHKERLIKVALRGSLVKQLVKATIAGKTHLAFRLAEQIDKLDEELYV